MEVWFVVWWVAEFLCCWVLNSGLGVGDVCCFCISLFDV